MKKANLRKTKDQLIKDYQEKLDLCYNLVDYFLTIGVEPQIFQNQWLYDASIEELNTIYAEQLQPKIINKFPSFDKKEIGITDDIIQHCFPLGFKVHEFNEEPQDKIFSILLDNNNYSSFYQLKYVVCLIMYESINDYKKLYEKYYNINPNNNSNDNNKKNSVVHNSFVLEQNGPLNFNDNLSTYSSNTYYNNNCVNKILNNYSLLSYNSTKNPALSDYSQRDTNISSFFNNRNLKKYYIPKCICLVSLYPFIIELTMIIKSIYKYSRLDKIEIPLEKIINNLILEVPRPPRGLYTIEYPLFEDTLKLTNSKLNEIFYADFEFDRLFVTLNSEQILKIFQYLMLGVKILFFSTKTELLTPIILTSLILLFPFKFPFPVVSILPKDTYYLIDSITPEILGINEKYYPYFFKDNDIDITDYLLVVDIDEQKLIPFKPPTKEELPPLPRSLKDDITKKLKDYNSLIHKNMKQNKKEPIKKFQSTIRNFFLDFQVELLKDYPQYLNSNIYKHPNENPFKVKKFLKNVPKDYYAFYQKFIETQMFNDYIIKRLTPKDKKEQTEVLYFEEKIFTKSEKSPEIIFLNSNLFDFNNQYKVPKVTSNMDKDLLLIYNNEENHKKFLLEGTNILTNNTKNENDMKNKPLFKYFLFPILNNDLFFENEIKSYYLDLSIFNEIKNINSELISKSHLGRVEIQTAEMTNFVYLLWLKVWANSFYYHDKVEQKYRYFQMLKVFNKISQHEMNVIGNLFQGLFRGNADEDLIVNLYIKILQLKLSPSIDIFNSIKNMIRRKMKNSTMPSSEIAKYLSNKEQIKFNINDTNKKEFRKRTMKSIYDMHITKEKVHFILEEDCNNCDKKIKFHDFQKNINNTNNDIVWAKCPFCQFSYLPKLKVIFGDEINKNDKLSKCTSIVDEVILYSPKTLKMDFFDNSNIDIDNLKLNYNPIFWNLVWYFKINGLPFDFILPYEGNIFRAKPKNKKFFNVKFSNMTDQPEKKEEKEEKEEKLHTQEKMINNGKTNPKKNNNFSTHNRLSLNNHYFLNLNPIPKYSIFKPKIYPNNIIVNLNKNNINDLSKNNNNSKSPIMQMNNNIKVNNNFPKKFYNNIPPISKVRKISNNNIKANFVNSNNYSPMTHIKSISYINYNNNNNNYKGIYNQYLNNCLNTNNIAFNNNNLINKIKINNTTGYNNKLNLSMINGNYNNINLQRRNIVSDNIRINNSMINNTNININNINNINNNRIINTPNINTNININNTRNYNSSINNVYNNNNFNVINNQNFNNKMNILYNKNINNNNANLINNLNNITPIKTPFTINKIQLINPTNMNRNNYYQNSVINTQPNNSFLNYLTNNHKTLNNSYDFGMNKNHVFNYNNNKIILPRFTSSYTLVYPYKV